MDCDEIILAEKNIQLAQFESVTWSSQFRFIEHHEVIAGVLFYLWSLVLVAAIFNRQMMEAELLRQLCKIPARWIAYVGPNDIVLYLSQIADVSNRAFFNELLRLVIQGIEL